jgi:hypothetical protein
MIMDTTNSLAGPFAILVVVLILGGLLWLVVGRSIQRNRRNESAEQQTSLNAGLRPIVLSPPPAPPVPPSGDSAPQPEHTDLTGPHIYQGSTYLQNGRYHQQASYQQGYAGEEEVACWLKSSLDDHWSVFRNVLLPDQAGDLDMVLVGPGGVYVLEVKAYTGALRVENGRWYRQTHNGYWARQPWGPGAQARSNAQRLSAYLKQCGITHGNWVEPIVVLIPGSNVDLVSSGTIIWRWEDRAAHLAGIMLRPTLTAQQVANINATLQLALATVN